MTYLGYQDRIRYRQSIILQIYYKANLKNNHVDYKAADGASRLENRFWEKKAWPFCSLKITVLSGLSQQHCFKDCCCYSMPSNLSNVGDFFRSQILKDCTSD